MKKIRIFISSPGDVIEEREIAKKVVCNLAKIYAKEVIIEPLLWEDLPLSSTNTFQEGIDYFLTSEPIDIAVFILWSRLGSCIGKNYKKKEGTVYQSGTEYEYDMMQALRVISGKYPHILVYIKTSDDIPAFKTKNLDDLEEAIKQKRNIESFIQEKFYDSSKNAYYAHFKFEEAAAFEQRIFEHLKNAVDSIVGSNAKKIEWQGNPYRGFKSFDIDHKQIFFGRTRLIGDIMSKIRNVLIKSESASILLLGESGCGKSSLAKAGIISQILEGQLPHHPQKSFCVDMTNIQDDCYNSICNILLDNFGYNYPNASRPTCFDNEASINGIINSPTISSCLIFFDQFEKIFDTSIVEKEREKILKLVLELVNSNHWIIVAMRNDYYHYISKYQIFTEIHTKSLHIDVTSVTGKEIAEIIEKPAQKAGVTWEINSEGVSLSEFIQRDAEEIHNLPLIEFALSRLYELKDENSKISLESYESIGKIEGAIINHLDTFTLKLNQDEYNELPVVFSKLVSISTNGKLVRRTACLSEFESQESSSIIKKLIDNKIVTSNNDGVNPVVSFSHDIIVEKWELLTKWADNHKEFIRSQNICISYSDNWERNNKNNEFLMCEYSLITMSDYLAYKFNEHLLNGVKIYIYQSIKAFRTKHIWISWAIAILSLLFLITSLLADSYTIFNEENNESIISYGQIFTGLLIFVIFIYSVHDIIRKKRGISIFTTARYNLYLGLAINLLNLLLLIIFAKIDSSIISIALLYQLIYLVILGVSVLYRRQVKCISFKQNLSLKKLRLQEYFINNFYKFLFLIVVIFCTYSIIIYNVMSNAYEQNINMLLANQQNLQIATNPQLQQINQYLINNHKDVLTDGKYNQDNDKDLIYAISLYGLNRPELAIEHLFPDSWHHQLLKSLCFLKMGLTTKAKQEISNLYNTKTFANDTIASLNLENIVWTAEILGDFELAKYISDYINKIQNNKYLNSPSYWINQGHIFLNSGNYPEIVKCKNIAIEKMFLMGVDSITVYNYINHSMTTDYSFLYLFNGADRGHIKNVSNILDIQPILFETENENNYVIESLCGKWKFMWREQEIEVEIKLNEDKQFYLFTYYLKQNSTDEYLISSRSLVKITNSMDDIAYWEYNVDTQNAKSGNIVINSNDSFIINISLQTTTDPSILELKRQ